MIVDVQLVTTWGIACGVSEHSRMLKEAVEAADPTIEIRPNSAALDPYCVLGIKRGSVIHLNYHAALHSQWTPAAIQLFQAHGHKVLVTYHDTGVPNSDQCKAIHAVADRMVIHEPAEDLPGAIYWRMGVPAAYLYTVREFGVGSKGDPYAFKQYARQPVLGSVGFPFGWKNYSELARVTKEAGWALLLIAPSASPEQIAEWKAINPHLSVWTEFVEQDGVTELLSACDATAFCYVCHNTGQSGAILQGIAARKPVIALSNCRQFRALYEDDLGHRTIRWCETFEEVQQRLAFLPIMRVDPPTVALAEQESWAKLGAKYAALYRELAEEGR